MPFELSEQSRDDRDPIERRQRRSLNWRVRVLVWVPLFLLLLLGTWLLSGLNLLPWRRAGDVGLRIDIINFRLRFGSPLG